MTKTQPQPSQDTLAGDLKIDHFLCYAIYSAGHALNRFYKPLLRDLGLTYPQYLAMVALWEHDDQTVGSLAQRLSLESHTLTPMLKRLESMGHVRRMRNIHDERQVRICLTEKGQRLRLQALNVPTCIRDAVGMSAQEIERMQRGLTMLRERLDRTTGPASEAADS